jgi:hypothetical protein
MAIVIIALILLLTINGTSHILRGIRFTAALLSEVRDSEERDNS